MDTWHNVGHSLNLQLLVGAGNQSPVPGEGTMILPEESKVLEVPTVMKLDSVCAVNGDGYGTLDPSLVGNGGRSSAAFVGSKMPTPMSCTGRGNHFSGVAKATDTVAVLKTGAVGAEYGTRSGATVNFAAATESDHHEMGPRALPAAVAVDTGSIPHEGGFRPTPASNSGKIISPGADSIITEPNCLVLGAVASLASEPLGTHNSRSGSECSQGMVGVGLQISDPGLILEMTEPVNTITVPGMLAGGLGLTLLDAVEGVSKMVPVTTRRDNDLPTPTRSSMRGKASGSEFLYGSDNGVD